MTSNTSAATAIGDDDPVEISDELADHMAITDDGNVGINTSSPQARFHMTDTSGDNALRISSRSGSKSIMQFFNSENNSGWSMGFDQSGGSSPSNKFYIAHTNNVLTPVIEIFPTPTVSPRVKINGTLETNILSMTTATGGGNPIIDGSSASVFAKGLWIASTPTPTPLAAGELKTEKLSVTSSATVAGTLTVSGGNLTVNSGNLDARSVPAFFRKLFVTSDATFNSTVIVASPTSTSAATNFLKLTTNGDVIPVGSGWKRFGLDRITYSKQHTGVDDCSSEDITLDAIPSGLSFATTTAYSGTITLVESNGTMLYQGMFAGLGTSAVNITQIGSVLPTDLSVTFTPSTSAPKITINTATACSEVSITVFIDAFFK